MKKIMAIVLTVMLSLALALTLCACQSYGSDTFEGALSATSYDSEDAAISGFLQNEISGGASNAQYVDKTDKGELTQEQIDKLATADVLDDGDEIVSAKAVEVRYARNQSRTIALASEDDTTYSSFTIYVIVISPHNATIHEYRYYVPVEENGDAITRSHYEALFDPAKYTNCTQTFRISSTASAYGASAYVTIEYTLKIDNGKALMEMSVTGTAVASTKAYGYFEFDQENNSLGFWASKDGVNYTKSYQYAIGSISISDVNDFATAFMPQQFDYSFYEKTPYGFKLQDGFLDEYFNDSISQTFQGAVSADLHGSFGIYVQDGLIAKLDASTSGSMSFQGYTYSLNVSNTAEYGSFGTTTVTRPAGIAA